MLSITSTRFVVLAAATLSSLVFSACALPTDTFNLEARASKEFIGYTGTETNQAELYEKGQLVKESTSGAGYDLGNGIYLSDSLSSVTKYAQDAAHKYGTSAMVCYFYATDKNHWRKQVPKVWIPRKDSTKHLLLGQPLANVEQNRVNYVNTAFQIKGPFVRLGELGEGANQMALPSDTTTGITVECVPAAQAKSQSDKCNYVSLASKWNVKLPSKNLQSQGLTTALKSKNMCTIM